MLILTCLGQFNKQNDHKFNYIIYQTLTLKIYKVEFWQEKKVKTVVMTLLARCLLMDFVYNLTLFM